MRTGIFGGSFDPVHAEHVRLAESAVKSLRLDRLLVMPAHTPPHKRDKVLSSDADRLAMCRIAFRDVPGAEVSDYEITRGGTSYTYLTCRHFKAEDPEGELFWLVGTDMLRDFPTWREPEDILQNATLAVCARAEKRGWAEAEEKVFAARFQKPFAVIPYEGKEVSSTRIRVLAAAGEDVSPYTGKVVAAYLAGKGLYRIPNAEKALSLEKPSRRAHSIRVAFLAAERAKPLGVDEKRAVTAALFHDCAKNLPPDSPYLSGFLPPPDVPGPVLHQYAGAYVAEKLGVTDEGVLDAIRYHTSGRREMTALGKLVFLADLLEEGRTYDGVDRLRALFAKGKEGLDECMEESLKDTLAYLGEKGGEIYPLTREAYEYYKAENLKKKEKNYGGNHE